jgi:hypothetical protein
MSRKHYWNPVMDSDKSGELRGSGWPEYVRVGGRTCSVLITGIWLGNRICPDFMVSWSVRSFSMIYTSPTNSMHPQGSSRLFLFSL